MRHEYQALPCGCMALVLKAWTFAHCAHCNKSFTQDLTEALHKSRKPSPRVPVRTAAS